MMNTKVALETFHVDYGRFPTTDEGLDALIHAPPGIEEWYGPYLDKLPIDEWGQPLHYRLPDSAHPDTYELHSSGPDGIDGTKDDITKEMLALRQIG